jgi:hypothetical protein
VPFAHEAYLHKLIALRDQLKTGLSAATPEPGSELLPTVAEFAEQIKALKAANTIEGTPQRAGQRSSSAEEPITTRIRRRTESRNALSTRKSDPVEMLRESRLPPPIFDHAPPSPASPAS